MVLERFNNILGRLVAWGIFVFLVRTDQSNQTTITIELCFNNIDKNGRMFWSIRPHKFVGSNPTNLWNQIEDENQWWSGISNNKERWQTIILYHDGRGSAIIRNVGYKNLENKAYFEKINIFSYFWILGRLKILNVNVWNYVNTDQLWGDLRIRNMTIVIIISLLQCSF